jgi:hypothetical protein
MITMNAFGEDCFEERSEFDDESVTNDKGQPVRVGTCIATEKIRKKEPYVRPGVQ